MKKIILLLVSVVLWAGLQAQSPLLDKRKYEKGLAKIKFEKVEFTVKGSTITTIRLSDASHEMLKETKVSDLQNLYFKIKKLEDKMNDNRGRIENNTPKPLQYKGHTTDYIRPQLANPTIYYTHLLDAFTKETIGAYMDEYKVYDKLKKAYEAYIKSQMN